jgi:hypothetical protein
MVGVQTSMIDNPVLPTSPVRLSTNPNTASRMAGVPARQSASGCKASLLWTWQFGELNATGD